jgi:Zn-dependent M32 family carboxypeptidase
VGRSQPFWNHFYPQLRQQFPEQFKNTDPEPFYKGINKVQPSLIRTEADEITYHFHVYIRYALEKRLLEGTLKTADIPGYWNTQYKEWMQLTVPDDKRGCLQDVHWSHGSFGYFATYSLGSFYAAQFYAQAVKELPWPGKGNRQRPYTVPAAVASTGRAPPRQGAYQQRLMPAAYRKTAGNRILYEPYIGKIPYYL